MTGGDGSRRTALRRTLVALGAALLLAGCGASGDPGAPAPLPLGTGAAARPLETARGVETTDGRLGGATTARPSGGLRGALRRAAGSDVRPRARGERRDGVGAGAACPDQTLAPAPATLAGDGRRPALPAQRRARRRRPAARSTLDAKLSAAARAYAADLVAGQYFSHTGRDGSTIRTRLDAAGYLPRSGGWAIGENLAWGTGAARDARVDHAGVDELARVTAQNILNPSYREIGIGDRDRQPVVAERRGRDLRERLRRRRRARRRPQARRRSRPGRAASGARTAARAASAAPTRPASPARGGKGKGGKGKKKLARPARPHRHLSPDPPAWPGDPAERSRARCGCPPPRAGTDQPMADLEGKRVLITGASSGIGFAAARAFARAGADVALTARGEEGLERAAADRPRAGRPRGRHPRRPRGPRAGRARRRGGGRRAGRARRARLVRRVDGLRALLGRRAGGLRPHDGGDLHGGGRHDPRRAPPPRGVGRHDRRHRLDHDQDPAADVRLLRRGQARAARLHRLPADGAARRGEPRHGLDGAPGRGGHPAVGPRHERGRHPAAQPARSRTRPR